MSTDHPLDDPTGEERDWASPASPDAIEPASPDSADVPGDAPEGLDDGDAPEGLDDGETDLLTDGELQEPPPILGNLR